MSPALQERPTQPSVLVLPLVDDTLAARWVRWHADAAAGDRRLQRRAYIVGGVLACGFVVWLLVILNAG
jgi:hypothetical protein